MKIKVEELTAWSELITKLIVTGLKVAAADAEAKGKSELTIEELDDLMIKPNEERLERWRKKAGLE